MLRVQQLFVSSLLLTLFSVIGYGQKSAGKVDYAKKIEAATPKPLPQSPLSKKETTDAQDDNLKGKIKTLVGERIGLMGVEKPIGKRMSRLADFDEKGNYLREVYFEYRGIPYTVTAYGYIDGARASISNDIDDDYAGSVRLATGKEKKEIKTKPDPRYKYKYEYKYSDGKLVEMQMIRNTGEKGMRYEYKFKGNQREYLAYMDDGELNQKYLYTFDDKGNDIEQIAFNVRQAKHIIESKIRYEYESFDNQGNWTKRTVSISETENGKEVYTPLAYEYRTLTYYP